MSASRLRESHHRDRGPKECAPVRAMNRRLLTASPRRSRISLVAIPSSRYSRHMTRRNFRPYRSITP